MKLAVLGTVRTRHALSAIFPNRGYTLAGGLMSYGSSLGYSYHQVGIYTGHTGRILKGEKPADLPVQQVTKIEMIINLKTTKVLGVIRCASAPIDMISSPLAP